MGHLSALLKKNMILWRRGGICAYCEIILPLLFCLFFFLMRGLADQEDIDKTSYISYDPDVNFFIPYDVPSEFSGTTSNNYKDIISQGIQIQNCINNKRNGDLSQNGFIALAPQGNPVIQDLKDQIEDMGYTYQYFDDKEDLLEYIKSEDYNDDVCIGITFDEADTNSKWSYNLHFNTTSPSNFQIPPTTYFEEKISYKIENLEDFLEPWIESGFITLQNWIDNSIAKQEKSASYPINPIVTSMAIESHVKDDLPDIMVGNFSTFTTLPLIVVFLRFLYCIVSEKEQKIREQMRIMGLSNTSFYMSWIIQYAVIYFIIALITVIFCAITIFSHSDFILMLVWYYLFCLNCIAQALLVSTLFSKAKIANIVGLVIYLGFYIITMIVGNNKGLSTGSRAALSIFPQVNQSISADVFVLIETKDTGIGWDDLSLEVDKYYIGISLIMYLVSLGIQLLLFFYLDQVVPSEIGVRKHPLFCLGFKSKNKIDENKDQKHEQKDENIEDVEQYLKQLQQEKECLQIDNMGKVYPNGKRAVNNLSLTMFRDQIFCLLGHNGSGKSTSISMLTGMTSMTEGQANVFGLDVQTDLEKIRKIMGICPQHDILFDNLTVYEHLQLYATIKGRTDVQQIEEEINQLLDDVDLQFKRNALSKTLSGGQKRRLSVAMAFVGGSKIIYLDEPTSGCDTSVRRHIWDMLKKYKQGRIMVLTTHFMDEADYLGDRISIIGEGKLICTGSPNFLKTKFGVGYNLTIVKNDPISPSDQIVDLIKKHIPNLKKPKITSAEIAFQLNMSEVSKFQNLFEEIDSKKKQLDIANYGISITTMEQVFLEVSEKNSTTKDEEDNLEQIRNSSLVDNKIDNFNLNDVRIKDPFQIFTIHFWALVVKRFNYFKRDKKGLACEVFIPCIMLIFGLYATTVENTYEDDPYVLATDLFDFEPQTIYAGDISENQLKDIFDSFSEDYKYTYTDKNSVADWDEYVYDKKHDNTVGAYYVTSYDDNAGANYILESNSLYRDALPLYMHSMNEALIKKATNNNDLSITTKVHSFPLTAKLSSLVASTVGIGVAFTFALLLSFIPSSLVSFIIKERQDQVKHQQVVSGISLKAYWMSNYFIDLAKYLVPVYVLSIILLFAYDAASFTDDGGVFAATCILLLLYGIAIIPFTYAFSFAFKNPGNGQVMVFFLNYICGGLLPMVVWMFRVFFESTRDVFNIIQWILRIFPSFSLGYGLMNLASRETYVAFFDDLTEVQSAFDIDIALGDIIMMIIMTIIYGSMILLFEKMKSKGTLDKYMASKAGYPQYQPTLLDDDVQKEQDLVEKSDVKDYVIRLNKVRKVFKTIENKYLEAVKQVSVGIKTGECFALLGINGAGKTTLFKILSGDHQSTSGQAHINGYDVSTEMDIARYAIGYCPQFDALLENLTTREHLELYAAIKGIPKNIRKELIDNKIEEMNLKKFENIPAGTYSGGNKRKLSVAIAMIGNPPVVLLDEPSTGMDPKARRFMWSVISRISTKRKSSSIVLTTHSMEEAEALSTKMVIMVEGQFKCMGSIQNIKSKFGQGYEIEVKVKIPKQNELEQQIQKSGLHLDYAITPETIDQTLEKLNWSQYRPQIAQNQSANELFVALNTQKGLSLQHLVEFFLIEQETKTVEEYIKSKFSKYSIIEHYGSFTRYKIETTESTGKIFGTFESAKNNLGVIDAYSVKQATIEAIFNQFATHQIKTEDFNKGGKFYKNNDNDFDNQVKNTNNQNEQQKLVANYQNSSNNNSNNIKQQQQDAKEKYMVPENNKQSSKNMGTEKIRINGSEKSNDD